MILRPVRPQSACGPPSSNWPVGLTKTSKSSSANCSGSDGVITCSISAGRSSPSMLMPGSCWVEMSTVRSRFGHAVLVVDRHLRLAVGAQEVDDALLADLGEAPASWCASQIGIGMSASVSSHA